ncbi:MAG: hypothetical protein ISQ97_00165 [Flavobacteriales bacterium]|nr:hypothetical protein [Flavobacteriales bacterium]
MPGSTEHPFRAFSASKALLFSIAFASAYSNGALAQDNNAWWKGLFQQRSAACDSAAVSSADPGESTRPAPITIDESYSIIPAESGAADPNSIESDSAVQRVRKEGDYQLMWDPRMAQLDSAWKTESHPLNGYRIQLFSGSLQKAREFRAVARRRTDLPVYMSSMPPNYRLTIGDFRNKWGAENVKQQWLGLFPLALVIPMEIELPTFAPSSEKNIGPAGTTE